METRTRVELQKGFTLAEVLVTIVILIVLLSIAFPTYSFIIRRAHGLDCQAHLRQLGTGLNSYLTDHQMTMPRLRAARSDRTDDDQHDLVTIDVALADYVDHTESFKCPSDEEHFRQSGTSYYWNSILNGQSAMNLKFLIIEDEVGIPVFADKEAFHKGFGDAVNILYADGRVEKDLKFWVAK